MDCHRCMFIRYAGCSYGRCSHPLHPDVRLVPKSKRDKGASRPYSKQHCNEFMLRRKCSNCKNWIRGAYYADGMTPARKGRCGLNLTCSGDGECPSWEIGPTSWKKRSREG